LANLGCYKPKQHQGSKQPNLMELRDAYTPVIPTHFVASDYHARWSIDLSICLSVCLSVLICPDLIWSDPILSYPILSYPILSYPILSYPILSYPILSYPILSNPIQSNPIQSNPIQSNPIQSIYLSIYLSVFHRSVCFSSRILTPLCYIKYLSIYPFFTEAFVFPQGF
jgi:hypothetical protein